MMAHSHLGVIHVCVLVILVFREHCVCQPLGPGMSCNGEKRDLCGPGTVCEYNQFAEGNVCRVLPGLNCSRLSTGMCSEGYVCDTLGPQIVCKAKNGESCEGDPDACRHDEACDMSDTCKKKVGEWCNSYYESNWCGAGAQCQNSKCTCVDGTSSMDKRGICVPVEGRVGGACREGKTCDDPNASCNTTTSLCDCACNFTTNWDDFSCGIKVGAPCLQTNNGDCTRGAVCDNDGTCRLKPRQRCTGENTDKCMSGSVCSEGICKLELGGNWFRYSTVCPGTCMPGTVCSYSTKRCALELNAACSTYKEDHCRQGGQVCDKVSGTCKIKPGASCSSASTYECAAGSKCASGVCRCIYTGTSFAPSTYMCALPKGALAAQCGTKANPENGCSDRNARCKNNVCVCRSGFKPDLNKAVCELGGPKCFIMGEKTVSTFFEQKIEVALPCSFKLANFQCGGVQVEVFGSKRYSKEIDTTYVSDVTVRVITTQNDVSCVTTYSTSSDAIVLQNATSWVVQTPDPQCTKDKKVSARIYTDTGIAILKRKLMRITYRSFFSRPERPDANDPILESSVALEIQCGHNDFEAMESYPDALCGSLSNTAADLAAYKRELELEARVELPERYPFMDDATFSARRQADNAVLRTQHVIHTDSVCEEASSIARGQCAGLHEKLYNCSNMFDSDNFQATPLAACVDRYIDPQQLYVICLRALCDVTQQPTSSTCKALSKAGEKCDGIVGKDFWHPMLPRPPFIKMAELAAMIGCSAVN